MARTAKHTSDTPTTIRCAIYTRKSTEDGLEQEFNSLDAQRDSAEAYIASQKSAGWTALPDRYDDGGFTGGNMERPALDRLLKDIEAGKVDCVVVYKVDRLSRSLMDFARIMEVFDRHKVSFVSVTQHFNTTHSMGRLTLNILLSFAQFEREIIGERIRDKIAAQRRKGKWAGGIPVLGYDVDRSGPSPKLVVNAEEAARVRTIFDLYLKYGALLPTVQELARRGWTSKHRQTKRGGPAGGQPFNKATLHKMLVNPVYIGKVVHKREIHDGEHPPIVDPDVFKRVSGLLQKNRYGCGPLHRNKYAALLRGLLFCKSCGRAMVHTFTGKKGPKGQQYRYYTCTNAIKRGHDECPCPSLPAAEIERVVAEQIRAIGRDPDLLRIVVQQLHAGTNDEIAALETERDDLDREITRHNTAIKKTSNSRPPTAAFAAQLVDLYERVGRCTARKAEISRRLEELAANTVDPATVEKALRDFDRMWACLSPREQTRLIGLLIQRVDYDAHAGTLATQFHATGIKTLAEEPLGEAA
jgi:site-specific DNA recombinase